MYAWPMFRVFRGFRGEKPSYRMIPSGMSTT